MKSIDLAIYYHRYSLGGRSSTFTIPGWLLSVAVGTRIDYSLLSSSWQHSIAFPLFVLGKKNLVSFSFLEVSHNESVSYQYLKKIRSEASIIIAAMNRSRKYSQAALRHLHPPRRSSYQHILRLFVADNQELDKLYLLFPSTVSKVDRHKRWREHRQQKTERSKWDPTAEPQKPLQTKKDSTVMIQASIGIHQSNST